MANTMDASIRHAQNRAQYMHSCGSAYIIHISLKELGIPTDEIGYVYAKNAVAMLSENRTATLANGIYLAVGMLTDPMAGEKQVEQAIRSAIKKAWKRRDDDTWRCYFPIGSAGRTECPSNRDFLIAVVDFIELWEGCCKEVEYAKVC